MGLRGRKVEINKCVILLAVMFIGFGCKQKDEEYVSDYSVEIQNLITDELKRAYLEAIFKADQDVRNAEEEYAIVSKYGRDSEEFREHLAKMKETDAISLNKVEAYLAQYGHPSKAALKEIAALTPWAVVHHQSEYEPRVTNFNHLYKGYLNNDIEEGSFSMYLARMYQIKNGERLDMKGPYKEADKIALMIEELGLNIE